MELEINSEGTLVWSIGLDGFATSKEASRGRHGQRAASLLYKAAWAYEWADDTTIEIGREVQVLKAT